MPTTRVPAYRCGTDWFGWLDNTHPTVEEGEVHRKVCFSNRPTGCKYSVDPLSSTNITHLLISHATVAQTECEANTA